MSPQRKLDSYGPRGARVRVFLEDTMVRVQWKEHGRRRTQSWPDSRDNRRRAKAFAEGVAEKLALGTRLVPEAMTLAELWRRYLAAVALTWRPATLRNAQTHWQLFTAAVGDGLDARRITPEAMDEVQLRLRGRAAKGRKRSPVQVARCLNVVRAAFTWAAQRRLLEPQLATWRPSLAKDERPLAPAEYGPGESARILAALDFRNARQWRAWVVLTLAATLGRRWRAILALHVTDVDLRARTVRWSAEGDKQGREAVVPMPRAAVMAVRVALVWRRRQGHTSPLLVPGVQARSRHKPYTYQAVHYALREAEQRAGVPHLPYRALHGFRRGVVTSVHAATGNLELAGELVGDRDVKTLRRSYLKARPEQLRAAVDVIDTLSNQNATASNPDAEPPTGGLANQ